MPKLLPQVKSRSKFEYFPIHICYIEFQIDLPGIENYGFEGESSFMICKHGAVASDSEEASKVGRSVFLSTDFTRLTLISFVNVKTNYKSRRFCSRCSHCRAPLCWCSQLSFDWYRWWISHEHL